MLRILILSDSAAPHTRRWAQWFAKRHHDVQVVSLNGDGVNGYDPARVSVIWRPAFGNTLPVRLVKAPIVIGRLRSMIRRYRPHLIHAHSAGGYAWLAALSGFTPYVVTPWGTDLLIDAKNSWLNRMMTGWALRRASLVTTDGFHFAEILSALGVEEARTFIHMFGVNVDHFSPGPDGGERSNLGLDGHPVVISTRTPNPVHSVETFVKAIPMVLAEHPDARFVIVGDGIERKRLEDLASSTGVASSTRFVGMVDEARMRRLLRAADVYVSTSLMDAGLAGSTAEAMATGLPVVHTKNSDNARWAPEGEGGFLVANGDERAVANAVNRLLKDPQLRQRMGARNRHVIVDGYNTDKEMARVEAEYLRLAGTDV